METRERPSAIIRNSLASDPGWLSSPPRVRRGDERMRETGRNDATVIGELSVSRSPRALPPHQAASLAALFPLPGPVIGSNSGVETEAAVASLPPRVANLDTQQRSVDFGGGGVSEEEVQGISHNDADSIPVAAPVAATDDDRAPPLPLTSEERERIDREVQERVREQLRTLVVAETVVSDDAAAEEEEEKRSDIIRGKDKARRRKCALLCVGIFLAVMVGLTVYFTKDRGMSDESPSYQTVLGVLSSVSSSSDLADPSTPQGYAANWITGGGNGGGSGGESDGLNLELDVGQSYASWDDRVVSEQRFKQRYALVVLHKALAGPMGIGGNGKGVSGTEGGGRRDRHRNLNRRRGPQPGRKKARRRLLDMKKEGEANTARNVRTRAMQITVESDPKDEDGQGIGAGKNRNTNPDSSRWLSPNDECLWAGITCEPVPAVNPVTGKYTGKNESVVVGIVLDSSELAGTLPSEIGTALTSLQELSLYSNAVTGPIPKSLTTLRYLHYLDLGSNHFNGEVPLFGPDLEYLYLNENGLSGPLPSPLSGDETGGNESMEEDGTGVVGSQPYKLKDLRVYQNALSGEVPEGIARFEALEFFMIDGNRVSSTLPESISALSEIRHLDVSRNTMNGSLPDALYELSSLDHLDLSSNSFSGSLSSEVARLTNLEYLGMDSNKFTGPVPEALAKLSNLTSLLLQVNKISGVIPAQVCGLTTTSGGGMLESLEADCNASSASERNERGGFNEGDEDYYYYVMCDCCTKCYPKAA